MTTSFAQQDNKQLVYLYDLPKGLATSVKIAAIIKAQTNYDLPEPVQFRDCKPHPVSGLPSPYVLGMVKIDPSEWKRVSDGMKYFDFEDEVDQEGQKKVWPCRALAFDRDLLGVNKANTNSQLNVYVKCIPKDQTTADLDAKFSTVFGVVKSAKISRSAHVLKETIDGRTVKKIDATAPPTSNGYGFVCFQNKESFDAALAAGHFEGLEIERYQPKDPREQRKVVNNIYVKNFNPLWDEEVLRTLFRNYGDIMSLVVMKKTNKDGEVKPFAFVCYDHENDRTYGPKCAENAVADLHDKEFDGFKIYVQPAVPLEQRQAQVQREQQRFKNSKKKCNLFVKGFPQQYQKENLEALFGQFGEIESVKIIPS